jgi:hypothetical protein
MPKSISRIAEYMQQSYRTGETWWSGSALPSDALAASSHQEEEASA